MVIAAGPGLRVLFQEHLVKRVLWKTLRGSQREKPGDVLDENFEPADIGLDVTLGSAGRVCLM